MVYLKKNNPYPNDKKNISIFTNILEGVDGDSWAETDINIGLIKVIQQMYKENTIKVKYQNKLAGGFVINKRCVSTSYC